MCLSKVWIGVTIGLEDLLPLFHLVVTCFADFGNDDVSAASHGLFESVNVVNFCFIVI